MVSAHMTESNSNIENCSGTISTLWVECAYVKYRTVCVEFDDASFFKVRGDFLTYELVF